MNKQVLNNIVTLTAVNSLPAFLILFFYKLCRLDFKIYGFIQWMEDDTRKFVLYVFILLGLLIAFTAKLQLRIFEQLKGDFPWVIKVSKYMFIILILIAASIVVNYYFQFFQQLKDPISTYKWIRQNPKIFFSGVLYLLFIFMLSFGVIGNIYISSILTSFILIALGFSNFNKLNLREEPLYPSDFKEIGQLKEVIPMISKYLSVSQISLVILFFIFLGFLVFFLPKLKVSIWTRCITLVLALVMVYSFTFFPKTFMESYAKASDINVEKWDQTENYSVNGFLFGFISNLQTDSFSKPNDYSKQKVLEVAKKYINTVDETASKSKKSPNIVFLMSESFWDPTRLTNFNVTFSEDPMSHIRKLMAEQTSGYSLSPTFGGGTANVEFEALTGFTTSFLQGGAIPYQDIVDRKSFIPTIVSDLENKGYDTLAIHPFSRVFYKRDIAYKTFGFDQFIDQTMMKNTEKDPSGIINDESLSKEIIDSLKAHQKPTFIHAVSMQNHMPYVQGKYEGNDIKVTGLPSKATAPLEVYAEGVKESDKAFEDLVEQLQQLDEPTIVVFWGDHLPIFGAHNLVYKQAGYKDMDKQVKQRMLSETPLLIYSNYNTDKKELNTVSPFYFSPIVYDLTGLKKPPFYNLLDELRGQISAIKGKNRIGTDQQFIKKLTKKQNQLLSDYRLLEYDLLMGKQYSLDAMYPKK